ncbi:hypothetical protein Tco_1076041, partial [Tanacetum coccineum]
MRFIPQHKVVQIYGVILPDYLTNPAMKESEATKSDESPKPSSGKRVKATAKVAKSGKKKQPDLGLETLSEIALTEAEQIKLAIERSKTQLHISQPSNSGAHEGTGVTPGVPDVPTYESDNEQISWKSSEEEDDDERTESDNDGDDFVHPKFLTHDDEAKQDEEVNKEDSFDPRVQTPSHVKSTNDEDDDEEVQGVNIKGKEIDEEANNEEDEGNELYWDLNVNLEGQDVEMTNDQPTNVQTTQVIEDTHVIITPVIPEGQQQSSSILSGFVSNMLNPSPGTGIDSLFTESPSLVDVTVITIDDPPLLSTSTLLPPPTTLITHMKQTLVPTPATFKQTNHFAKAVSSILGIVDAYLANKMHEAVKTVVQLQSERLRDEAQAENADFLNKLDDNIKKIIKEQVKAQVFKILPKIKKTINKQLKVEVMTCSSTESKTYLAIAANLSELELKKILIEKMESNKSIHISDEQKNLYKALVDAYESDKLILDTYGDTGSKRRRARKEPELTSTPKEKTPKSTGKSTKGSKSHKSAGKSAHAEEPMHTAKDLEEPAHQEFETGATEDQLVDETPQPSNWFQKSTRLQSPDRDWNKTLPTDHGPVQPWLSNLAREEGPRESFDELMDTPLDFLAFMMNRLKVDTLTPELLAGYVIQRRVKHLQLGVKKISLTSQSRIRTDLISNARMPIQHIPIT